MSVATEAVDCTEAVARAQSAERDGALDQALHWYEHALGLIEPVTEAATASDLYRWIGRVHRQRGDLDRAVHAYGQSLSIAEGSDLPFHVASAANSLAIAAQHRGRIDEAVALYQRASELAVQVGDQRLAAMIDQNLGTLANLQGEVSAAITNYRSALTRFRALRDDHAAAIALNNLGMAHVDLGDWSAAEKCFDDAFDLADGLRDTGLIGMVELNRAELFLKQDEFARARECCDRAFEVYTRLDARDHLGEVYKFYGVLFREMQRPGLADAHFGQAVELAVATEDRLLQAEVEGEWAIVDLLQNRNQEALQRLNRSHRLFATLDAQLDLHAIESRLDGLENTYLRVVQQWAISIESKDRYTAGHCERVADYACRLAQAVGFAGRDLVWLRMGGFLHDVGKMHVPAEVLNKAGKLTEDEFSLMKSHTTEGDTIVAELNFPWDIRPIVRNHHERWDGTGYPDGLAGEEIPLTARILCIADVWDALTTQRSYRPALSREDALRIMDRDSGRLLDPNLYTIFRQLITAPVR